MPSIQDTTGKIKRIINTPLTKALFLGGLIIVVSISSFILGRMSLRHQQQTQKAVQIEYPPMLKTKYTPNRSQATGEKVGDKTSKHFVASQHGTKYYRLDCSGVNRINNENKVFFITQKKAREAGYEPSSRCFE